MSSKKYNVGIIGNGLSAKIFHIPFLQHVSELRLYAIVQRSPNPEDDAEKDHQDIKSYRSAHELVKDEEVDVVVVSTAPDSHFSLAKLALEAGKHGKIFPSILSADVCLYIVTVVVEKPFTPTSAEAQGLVALAKKKDRILTVYQNRRWDSDFLTLSKCFHSGALGRVVEFETHFDRHRPEVPQSDSWKYKVQPGGGAVYDLGTHLIDQVVHLFGMPMRITAFIGSQRLGGTESFEDSCLVLLHYDNGMLATCKAAVVSPEEKQLRYWVRGDKGSFKKFHLDCQEEQLKRGLRPGDDGFGLEPEERCAVLSTWNKEKGQAEIEVVPTVEPPTYADFYRKLARALAGDAKQVPVDPTVAANVIRLVELARQSSQEGKTLLV